MVKNKSEHAVRANDIFLAIKTAQEKAENPGMRLTDEQVAAVESDKSHPTLVIAGAGSGKTELMAIRALWLVANRYAKPEDILGLTFTRKAAAELSKRILNGLSDLRGTEYWPAELSEGYSNPLISTYNAYANSLFRDNALALGYEPESELLSEGAQYQLAKKVVLSHSNLLGSEMDDVDLTLKTAVDGVLKLSAELNDNLASGEQVQQVVKRVAKEIERVIAGGELPGTHQEFFAGLFKTGVLAELAEAYRSEKLALGYVDYSDQVALAELAARSDDVRARERELHKFVMLDEYQDTSFLQTKLLHRLFADHPVFAVGDPNQSIYGWRGASSTNLNEFVEKFSSKAEKPVRQLKLSRSWRNPEVVLAAANVTAAPLGQLAAFQEGRGIAKTEVVELEAREGAGPGQIFIDWSEDVVSEAKNVAAWMKSKMVAGGKETTAAVICRLRDAMPLVVSELEAQGLDVDVVGLGGLMEMPEIIDLVSTLRVVHSPNANGHLVRMLAGPRWRIGAKDIQRLHRWSRKLSKQANEDLVGLVEDSLGPEYESSLIDALDLLVDLDKASLYGMSEESLKRLRDAATFLRDLRAQTGLPLTDFVRFVARELQLDIELAANPRRVNPLAHLNAFYAMVSNYASAGPTYLGAFLEWLDFAESREKLEVPSVYQKKGVVQVLTIHAAKGLEWQYVAVPNLVDGDFPKKPKTTKAWFTAGVLPYELRGDVSSLPQVDLAWTTKASDFGKVKERLSDEMKVYLEREERRLAYVAFTRPKRELYLSGAKWKTKGAERSPSPYLLELLAMQDERITVVQQPGSFEVPNYDSQANPLVEHALTQTWPMDPLGESHRIKVERAAEEARAQKPDDAKQLMQDLAHKQEAELASAQPAADEVGEKSAKDSNEIKVYKLNREIDALVNEARVLETNASLVKLPVRIPASRFKDFVKDPKAMAEKYRRPVPEKPYGATMTGTLFHTWVEQRYGLVANTEIVDALDELIDELEAESPESLEQLQANFDKSRWASMKAREVESEIQVTIEQNTFICKIDAVFDVAADDQTLPGKTIEIVDWKTGEPPQTNEEIAERALQLALYKMAYSLRHGIPEQQIAVCLYYVGHDVVLRPDVLSVEEVKAKWREVLESF